MKSTYTILHLEDERIDHEIILEYIKRTSLAVNVIHVTNRDDFINTLLTTPLDLVLSDYHLPGFNGAEAIKIIREKLSLIPVILVTGYLGEELAVKLLREGADDYILKDNLGRLPIAIERALREYGNKLELKRVQELNSQIIEQVGLGIFHLSSEGKFLYANEYMKKFLGIDEHLLENQTLVSFIYDDRVYNSNVLTSLPINKEKKLHFRVKCSDGTFPWVECRIKKTHNDLLIGACLNITKFKYQEQKLFWKSKSLEILSYLTKLPLELKDIRARIKVLSQHITKHLNATQVTLCFIGKDNEYELIHYTNDSQQTTFEIDNRYQKIQEVNYLNHQLKAIDNHNVHVVAIPFVIDSCHLATITIFIAKKLASKKDLLSFANSLMVNSINFFEKNNEAIELAYLDELTKLPNRKYFYSYIEYLHQKAARQHESYIVFYVDLDNFKQINDNLGHDIGDKCLIEFSDILKDNIRKSDFCARIGGDEFCIISDTFISECESITTAQRLIDAVNNNSNFSLTYKVTVSIGIAKFPDNGIIISELIKNADTAMYQAKKLGKSQYQIYSSS